MSKAKSNKTPPARRAAAPAQTPQERAAVPTGQAPKIALVAFAVLAFKNHAAGVKIPVEHDVKGKALVKDVYIAMNENKPYYNEERGILVAPGELSHVYLVQEQVQV